MVCLGVHSQCKITPYVPYSIPHTPQRCSGKSGFRDDKKKQQKKTNKNNVTNNDNTATDIKTVTGRGLKASMYFVFLQK